MVTYVKLTNGSTTMLVNMYDEARQNELISDGFYYDSDEDGAPKTVESTELITNRQTEHSEMLKQIQDRLNKKSNSNKIKLNNKAQE